MPSPTSSSSLPVGVHRVEVRPIVVAEKRTTPPSSVSSMRNEQSSPAVQSTTSPSSSPLFSASASAASAPAVSERSASPPIAPSSVSALHSSSSASTSSSASSLLSVHSTVALHRSSSSRTSSSSVNGPSPPPRRATTEAVPCTLSIRCGHYSMQGLRAEMEDKVVLLPHPAFNSTAELLDCVPRSYFAVFDGHGGDVSASYCAQHVHLNFLAEPSFATAPSKALHAALLKTDTEFCAACRRINLMSSSGTTALCAYIQRHTLTVANIGDSRAILVKRSGAVQPLSSDHKPGRKDEKARIEALGGRVATSEEDAWSESSSSQPSCTFLASCFPSTRPLRVFPGGLSVSRTIGDIHIKQGMKLVIAEAEVWEADLRASEDVFVVMGCDGVWDVLSNQHVADLCRKWDDKQQQQQQRAQQPSKPGKHAYDELAEAIAKEAFKRGSSDNISAAVIKLDWQDAEAT